MQADAVRGPATPGPEPAETKRLRQVAQDFEAMILSHMLSTMRRAGGMSSVGGRSRSQGHLYQEMMDDELGRSLARSGGLGLADVLVRDLVRQTTTPKKPSSSEAERSMNPLRGGLRHDRPVGDAQ
jgi:peptidoglycan hydrolase FlgJ